MQYLGLAMGRNNFLNCHVDVDACRSMLSVISEEDHQEIVCYFVFPTLKVAVAMRNGDMLSFNASIPHCVSSRRLKDKEAFCASFYVGAGLAGNNDRSIAVGQKIKTAEAHVAKAMKSKKR